MTCCVTGPPETLAVTPASGDVTMENGSAPQLQVEVHDKAGNVTVQPRLNVVCKVRHSICRSLTYQPSEALAPSLAHPCSYPPTHSPTHSRTHSLIHSLTHLLYHALTPPLTHARTQSLTHSLTHSFTYSLITHLFAH